VSQSNKERLLQRLQEIDRSVAGAGNGLALIGLGSVGTELDRLDAYSDLDFFVIVKPGYKQVYLDDLSWLASIGPIAYDLPARKPIEFTRGMNGVPVCIRTDV
jgi:lincosamide nucleotidyltransferase B/F